MIGTLEQTLCGRCVDQVNLSDKQIHEGVLQKLRANVQTHVRRAHVVLHSWIICIS